MKLLFVLNRQPKFAQYDVYTLLANTERKVESPSFNRLRSIVNLIINTSDRRIHLAVLPKSFYIVIYKYNGIVE